MRIAVVGAGGLGGLMAALLIDAGEDVTLIARGATLAALRSDGLLLQSGMGDLSVRPTLVTDDARAAGVMDLVIIATKAWQLDDATRAITPMVGPSTALLPMQNGVEAAEVVSGIVDPGRVLVGIASVSSFQTGPGRIMHPGNGIWVRLGEQDNSNSDRANRIVAMLSAARMDCAVAPHTGQALWAKLGGLSARSAIGSLTGMPIGQWRRAPETVALYGSLMQETGDVAAALGAALPSEYVSDNLRFLPSFEPDYETSMQRDVSAGNRSELDAQIGVIVRKGRAAGVATPSNAFAYAALLPREMRAAELEASQSPPA